MPIYRKIKSKQTKILALRFFLLHSFTISTGFFTLFFQRQPSIFTEDDRFVEFFFDVCKKPSKSVNDERKHKEQLTCTFVSSNICYRFFMLYKHEELV